MAEYLLIESRDPFESNDVAYFYELAKGLVEAGNRVTLFLAQNGVMPARPSAHSATLEALARSGVTVLADDFSLKERGITKLAVVHDTDIRSELAAEFVAKAQPSIHFCKA